MNHPVRELFLQLTERGMSQLNMRDRDTIEYITNLLTNFVQADNMYRLKDESGRRLEYICDILEQASREMSPTVRREYYRQRSRLFLKQTPPLRVPVSSFESPA